MEVNVPISDAFSMKGRGRRIKKHWLLLFRKKIDSSSDYHSKCVINLGSSETLWTKEVKHIFLDTRKNTSVKNNISPEKKGKGSDRGANRTYSQPGGVQYSRTGCLTCTAFLLASWRGSRGWKLWCGGCAVSRLQTRVSSRHDTTDYQPCYTTHHRLSVPVVGRSS